MGRVGKRAHDVVGSMGKEMSRAKEARRKVIEKRDTWNVAEGHGGRGACGMWRKSTLKWQGELLLL